MPPKEAKPPLNIQALPIDAKRNIQSFLKKGHPGKDMRVLDPANITPGAFDSSWPNDGKWVKAQLGGLHRRMNKETTTQRRAGWDDDSVFVMADKSLNRHAADMVRKHSSDVQLYDWLWDDTGREVKDIPYASAADRT
jgi:hypothetical protein